MGVLLYLQSNRKSKLNSNHAQVAETHLLMIRFSSFGDIVQAASVPNAFAHAFPGSKTDWVVRSDFAPLLTSQPNITNVHALHRKAGLKGLVLLAWRLARSSTYTHLYDAHNNLRSLIFRWVFFVAIWWPTARPRQKRTVQVIVRTKNRWRRWLLFHWRVNTFPQPFHGAESFLRPLIRWSHHAFSGPIEGRQYWPCVASDLLPQSVLVELGRLPRPVVALAPSAAWAVKRWPLAHWKELIESCPKMGFVLLGGPEDQFLETLKHSAPERVINLAGRLSLPESTTLLSLVDLVIANDTGLLHVADQMEQPSLALIGPTAFGYPSHLSSLTMELDARTHPDLKCKPCSKDGRDGCTNKVYQRCLAELTPESVRQAAIKILNGNRGP